MESRSLRKWLKDRGCKFSQHKRAKRGQLGPAGVTVTYGRHTAELRQLGLDPAELPRYQSRV